MSNLSVRSNCIWCMHTSRSWTKSVSGECIVLIKHALSKVCVCVCVRSLCMIVFTEQGFWESRLDLIWEIVQIGLVTFYEILKVRFNFHLCSLEVEFYWLFMFGLGTFLVSSPCMRGFPWFIFIFMKLVIIMVVIFLCYWLFKKKNGYFLLYWLGFLKLWLLFFILLILLKKLWLLVLIVFLNYGC